MLKKIKRLYGQILCANGFHDFSHPHKVTGNVRWTEDWLGVPEPQEQSAIICFCQRPDCYEVKHVKED